MEEPFECASARGGVCPGVFCGRVVVDGVCRDVGVHAWRVRDGVLRVVVRSVGVADARGV